MNEISKKMPHITSHSVIFTFEVCVSVFSTFQVTILLIPHISSYNHATVRTPFGFIGKKILGHTYIPFVNYPESGARSRFATQKITSS